MLEHIYNSHYSNGVPAMFTLVLSSWKVNIAKKPIAVMGLYIRLGLEVNFLVSTVFVIGSSAKLDNF